MAKNRRNRRGSNRGGQPGEPRPRKKTNDGIFIYTEPLTIGDLATELNLNASEIVKYLFLKGTMVTINTLVDEELSEEIATQFGYEFLIEEIKEEDILEQYDFADKEEQLEPRPPVVTIMGHVDHGKTTLIDTIRDSRVAAGEAGSITQAIGAYQAEVRGKKITFIDTPGHEAFTSMRSRGAQATDIVVLIVAADDGVMPQTIEAIDHAKAAKVPIIVAVNKIDLPGANPQRVKDGLLAQNIVAEEYGGDTIFIEISAKQNIGIDELLDNILLLAEMQELTANPNRLATGVVLEARLDRGEGPKATLLVQNGTLENRDFVVVGGAYGKIRRMTNEYGKALKEAGPSTPVAIIGLSEVPEAGDAFMAFHEEKTARQIAEKIKHSKAEKELLESNVFSLDTLHEQLAEGEIQTINVIIKADNSGSAEAVAASLLKINVDGVNVNIIRSSAGGITESDILLAETTNSIVYGFNVRPNATVRSLAKDRGIDIRTHRVIYALIEEMEKAMKGLLKPEIVEEITGQATVLALWKASKVGTIGGCRVNSGYIERGQKVRLIRDDVVIHEGVIETMQHGKDQARQTRAGHECGITLKGYNDIHVDDVIEGYHFVEVEVT